TREMDKEKMMKRSMLAYFLMVFFFLAGAGFAFAGTGDDIAKQTGALIRSAEKNMFNGKMDDAVKNLDEAAAGIEALRAADADHKNLKALEGQYTRTRAQVDKKLKQKAGAMGSPQAAPPAVKKADEARLPGGVTKRLKDIGRHLDSADSYAAKDSKQAAYILQQADELFREIDKMYAGQFDSAHSDYADIRKRYDQLIQQTTAQAAAEDKAKAGEQASKKMQEQQSAQWIEKFRAYLSYPGQTGHNPDKLVFVPGTSEPEKFADAQKRYTEFKSFYETYRKTEFPNGKTWELEDLGDREAPERLTLFESRFSERMASVSGDAEKEIDAAMAQLERDNGWKKDPSIKPPIVDAGQMKSIAGNVEKASTALGRNSKAQALKDKYADLVEKDAANRKIRAERTLCFPNIYRDSDAGELKNVAGSIVKKEKPGSEILRISLYKDAWAEETVEEWTDTTKTARRIRTTRMINAHVAAKDGSGVFLHTLHIARDKQSGGWGGLYGHIMWSEPMLKANVNKDGVRK
ncbi:MAG: hypothetical protein ACOWYE_08635, partial [Desulfatiglandales bacterium]